METWGHTKWMIILWSLAVLFCAFQAITDPTGFVLAHPPHIDELMGL